MIAGKWLEDATAKLEKAGIGSARLDALILLEDCLGKDRGSVLAHPETDISKTRLKRLNDRLKRRVKHEPMAYIRGYSEFYGRKFKVNRHVLEPRPESEPMIDMLIEIVKKNMQSQGSDGVQDSGERRTEAYMKYAEGAAQPVTQQSIESSGRTAGSASRQTGASLSIADVGTGSGCLGISAALELHNHNVDLYDIDASALAVAKHNMAMHELRLKAYKRDLLSRYVRPYDIILANLPYVPDHFKINRAATLEPKLAIFGGKDGLDIYRRLFEQLLRFSWKPQFVLTESLPPQHTNLSKIALDSGYRLSKTDGFIQAFKSK